MQATLTQAQQYHASPDAEENYHIHYDTAIGEHVLEFDDGSIYTSDPNYTNDDEEPTFQSMDEFLSCVSIMNSIYAENLGDDRELPPHAHQTIPASGYVILRGTIEQVNTPAPVDVTLRLTGITRNGKPLELGSTDYHEQPSDEAPLVYTEWLAKLIGEEVTLRCQIDTYTEERRTSRGNSYHVAVDYLTAPMVMKVHRRHKHVSLRRIREIAKETKLLLHDTPLYVMPGGQTTEQYPGFTGPGGDERYLTYFTSPATAADVLRKIREAEDRIAA